MRAEPKSPSTDAPHGIHAPQILCQTSDQTVAIATDCVFVVVRKTVSIEGAQAIARGFEHLTGRCARLGYLSWIDVSGVAPMDAAARKLMERTIGDYTRTIGAAAMVVCGSSFKAAFVRSVLTAIHMGSRAQHPMRAFPELEPALEWYASKFPESALTTSRSRSILLELAA